ncbi:pescadillo-like protein [Plasmodium knowlesi strain H]|uniref:Pescadillo homolog n=3 Tax=Plasmodium knowlesi TaxID=5850 RepID=A0A5K1UAZ4_PLAKH|nr:pescadillo homolog, putative [Plasmodium knowlesi strain H]OTN65057.1 Pescadillo-like protein [Plasmodium knowlesi]CAA9988103.1 pescadillo homolog, putative [Plasmodium knowlesi strain H]SBO19972.1 pescadillo-like protein [Plasmodium knowlesi strain H]SBO29106.1 pescadillo-like protein [Plasmodium knowlesi strain H]VVS77577.1 pescadillo homolog, putative [Plasmodium knowlesi strain H]|eukprot:XP_002259078.1 pescadillo-like protein [Plasmodium knowlesi strain H]
MHIHKLRKKANKKKEGKYFTKKSILKKLYLKEKEFRKLCIFKGIYPKDFKEIPLKYRTKFYKQKVYYSKNDFKKLAHEKIIQDFRKIQTCLKKYKKYKLALEDEEKCKSLIKNFPKYTLDHIIKERFPVFSYAIEDLDDALSAIVAYSLLPSNEKVGIQNRFVTNCEVIKNHFHYYAYKTNRIKKAFITVKGYYLQAEILQKKVTWVIPHTFTPYLEKTIDFSIITTFIEYYICLLKFVLFKLYKMHNMTYPPEQSELLKNEKLKHLSYDQCLISLCKEKFPNAHGQGQESNQGEGKPLTLDSSLVSDTQPVVLSPEEGISQVEEQNQSKILQEDEEIKHNIDEENDTLKDLFKNQVYYIHTDMPLDILSLIILSSGGAIGWNSPYSPYQREDERITHEILEPYGEAKQMGQEKIERMYVQPQYIFDCLNRKKILPCSDYSVDVINLPVHLSPFIEDDNFKNFVKKEEYAINKLLKEEAEKNAQNSDTEDTQKNEHGHVNKEDEFLKSDDEVSKEKLQLFRNACLNNQMELEDEDNYVSVVDTNTNASHAKEVQSAQTRENIQRHKIALSKKKRKLYTRIERAERKQKLAINKFINKA